MHHRLLTIVLVLTFSLSGFAQAQQSFTIPETDTGLPGVGPIRRYDWFRNLWQTKRSAWAKRVKQDQKALVFLGDSITQGWGDDFGGAFDGVKVANRGISGDTTRGMLIRLKEDVLSLNPSCVVMLMGTNDLEENARPKTIVENVKLIVGALKKHNDKMPIVLCNVMPSSATKKRSSEDIQELNRLYGQAVRGDAQVTVVDTWTLFKDEKGDAKPAEFPDLLHPNTAGYAKWAQALRPVLATLGLMETTPDSFVIEKNFESLFNGSDLSGWMVKATPPQRKKQLQRRNTKNPDAIPWPIFDNDIDLNSKQVTPDGRYAAINNRLVVTTPSEGRRIQQLWTSREFGDDFVLKLEFRATPNADSGIFIRGKQLQCRDYLLAGPYNKLKRYLPQDWNEVVIKVSGETAYCTCNGEVLEKAFAVPVTGPIGLEGDRGQIEYRRIRIGKDDGNLLATTNRTESWRLETHSDGKGTMEAKADSVIFKTSDITDTDWHVQSYQAGLKLKEGAEYKVTFEMKSPDYATVVLLGMSQMPDDYHSIGLAEQFDTAPDFADFEFTFTATDVMENNRIGFVLGRDVGTVHLRNLKMVEVK